MARRGTTGNEPPLGLKVSLEQAEVLVEDRIQKGTELQENYKKISDQEFCQQASAWDDYNRSVIEIQLFGSERAIFKFYNSPSIRSIPLNPNDASRAMVARDDVVRRLGQLRSLKGQLPIFATSTPPSRGEQETEATGRSKEVFIAHGHDLDALESVRNFLQSLGLQPMVLSEQPDLGTMTIIEKLERETRGIGYAVAVVTPDDEAVGGRRARQNVIFELGFFIRQLGRSHTKVLRKGTVEWFSDLDGTLYIDMDPGGRWMAKLRRELAAANILPKED